MQTAVDRYTQGNYAELNPGWHEDAAAWKAAQIAKMLSVAAIRPATVCEIGCGSGEILCRLQDALEPSVTFEGLDISPTALSIASPKSNARLRFASFDETKHPPTQYDLLLLIDVVEHVEDVFGFMRMSRRWARNTIFHIPLDTSCLATIRNKQSETWDQVGHIHLFTKDTALKTLQLAGYTVKEYFYTDLNNSLYKTARARIAKIPRKLLFRLAPNLAVRLLGGYSLMVLCE